MSRTTICYANEMELSQGRGVFYSHFFPSAYPTYLSDDSKPILKFRLTEVTEDIPDDAYWSWWDNERLEFTHTYVKGMLLEMVFAYGSKTEVARGRGEVCRVILELLGSFDREEAKAADWKP